MRQVMRATADAARAARADAAPTRAEYESLTGAGWDVLGPAGAPASGAVPVDPDARDLTSAEGRRWLARRHEITQRRPPSESASQAFWSPRSSAPTSSFTAMRTAWKVRVAQWILPCRALGGSDRTTTSTS